MLHLIAELTIQPGSLAKVIEAARPCIAATKAEDGCISYDLHVDVTDDTKVVFVERWRDRAALEAHFKTPHLQAWREVGSQFVTGRKIEIIEGGKIETL